MKNAVRLLFGRKKSKESLQNNKAFSSEIASLIFNFDIGKWKTGRESLHSGGI